MLLPLALAGKYKHEGRRIGGTRSAVSSEFGLRGYCSSSEYIVVAYA